MKARFWGVRGSSPTPGRSTLRYGGNTACVEILLGTRRLILDAGSGLRGLGERLARGTEPVSADLLLSHTHSDHICGLPFFAPLFSPGNALRVWSGHPEGAGRTEAAVRATMTPPLMPDMASLIRATLAWHDFRPGATLDLGGDATARTAMLNHPGGCVGYRIAWAGRTLVYATDHGHGDPAADAALRDLCLDADVLIYDAMLTDAEFPTRADWGHSTWRAGVWLADACGVGQLVLFHHAPFRDDRAVAALTAEAAALRPGTIAAREGMTLRLGRRGTASRVQASG